MTDKEKIVIESDDNTTVVKENINTTTEHNADSQMLKEYNSEFLPGIHKWGRTTMVIGFFLTFLPAIYMYFIRGYREPAEAYGNVVMAIVAFGIGMWLTEPISYFPILGSAGTYMAYLSGNVGNMRTPVALSVQNTLKTDVKSPRGNLATIFAIAVSVLVNILILLLVVLAGSFIIKILPDSVKAGLAFVMPGLYGSLLVMMTKNNPKFGLTYLCIAAILYFIVDFLGTKIAFFNTIGLAFVMAFTILIGYLKFKKDNQ